MAPLGSIAQLSRDLHKVKFLLWVTPNKSAGPPKLSKKCRERPLAKRPLASLRGVSRHFLADFEGLAVLRGAT